MKKPFLHALGAALYIIIIVFVVQGVSTLIESQNGTIVVPMVMLSLFVLSAVVMGFFFLSEPLRLLIEGQKKEAVTFFAKIVGFFACFVALFTLFLFIKNPFHPTNETSNEKLNISVVCESALTYMSFPDGASAEKFVAECKEGKHPDVIERYKAEMNLGDGAAI